MTAEEQALWRATAESLGLEYREGLFGRPDSLEGRIEGVRLRVHPGSTAVFEAEGMDVRLQLGERAALAATVVLTGDVEFDRRVVAHGDASAVFALLEAQVRAALLDLTQVGEVVLENGILSWIRSVTFLPRQSDVEARVKQFVALAGRLETAAVELSGKIEERAATDPDPGVRANALRQLVLGFGRTWARDALARAHDDPEALVRRRAEELDDDLG